MAATIIAADYFTVHKHHKFATELCLLWLLRLLVLFVAIQLGLSAEFGDAICGDDGVADAASATAAIDAISHSQQSIIIITTTIWVSTTTYYAYYVALFFLCRTLSKEGVENVIGDDNRLVVSAIGSLLSSLPHSLFYSPGTQLNVCLMLLKLNTAIFGGNANLI